METFLNDGSRSTPPHAPLMDDALHFDSRRKCLSPQLATAKPKYQSPYGLVKKGFAAAGVAFGMLVAKTLAAVRPVR
jgi:hypothetical protein